MRQMLTQAQTAGQYFTNDQIKEMTRKVSAEVDLVHQQTQNQRYGSSHIGATAKDISNRSEERRVGKECRGRCARCRSKKGDYPHGAERPEEAQGVRRKR